MRRFLDLASVGLGLLFSLAACGDDSTEGTGGAGGAGDGGATATSTTATTGTTATTSTTTSTTSTTTTTSTGNQAVCEDAEPRPVDVILRNDSARRLYLADHPDYSGPDFGYFEVDGSVAGCPCLEPSFCSTGASNEAGPTIGYLEPGAEIQVAWTGLVWQPADAACDLNEGCVLTELAPDGTQTLRASAYGAVDCGGFDCDCDLTVEEGCYTSSIKGTAVLDDEVLATATLQIPGDTTVTLSFTD